MNRWAVVAAMFGLVVCLAGTAAARDLYTIGAVYPAVLMGLGAWAIGWMALDTLVAEARRWIHERRFAALCRRRTIMPYQ
ncbi:MAG: hypothetical protein ACOX5Z_00115 [Desulfobulbus sp.]|jgi:hypothetical protein